MTDSCKACRAPIVWVKHHSTGRAAPLDAEPTQEGNCLLLQDGTYVVLSQKELGVLTDLTAMEGELLELGAQVLIRPAIREALHTSHFQTCPDAASFRRKLVGKEGGRS